MAKVGVIGHRILMDLDKIHKGIDLAIAKIQEKFAGESLRLLTQFADGSDRMVERHFRDLDKTQTTVVLPLSIDEYLKDFSRSSAKEFLQLVRESHEIVNMPLVRDRDAAYAAARLYILTHSDVLICIWDGNPAQGRGGTGELAELARQRKIPFAWIHAGNRKPGTEEPTSLGADQGLVTFENF